MEHNNRKQRSFGERSRNRRAARVALLLCLSILMQLSPIASFGLTGTASAAEQKVLNCTAKPREGKGYADFFVHTHNHDCFDESGKLVCELKEIQVHEHDESCRDAEGNLTCGKKEVALHTHDESCFDKDGNLTCDKVEVREHVHGEKCFTTVKEEEPADEAGTDDTASEPDYVEDGETEAPAPQLITFPGEDQGGDEEHQPHMFFITGEGEEENDGEEENGGEDEESVEETQEPTIVFSDDFFTGGDAEETEEHEEPVFITLFPTDETEDESEEGTAPEEGEDAGGAEKPDGTEPAGETEEENDTESGEPVFYFLFPEEESETEEDNIDIEDTENGAEDAESSETIGEEETENTESEDAEDAENAENSDDAENTDADAEETETSDEPADEVTEEAEADADAPTETVETPAETPAVAVPMPAQTFTGSTETVEVYVEADEGAFPEGTTMTVTPVTDDETISAVTEAVEADEAVEGTVTSVEAVDITFRDAQGNQIEPLIPIRVSMKSAIISESDNVALVHVPNAQSAEVTAEEPAAPAETAEAVEGATDTAETPAAEAPAAEPAAPAETPAEENSDAPVAPAEAPKPEIIEAELVQPAANAEVPSDEIVFESDAFSVYALVGTTIETRVIAANGEAYKITVTCSPEAKIPAGATLDVREILPEGEPAGAAETAAEAAEVSEYDEYVAKTLEALGGEFSEISYVRFFDISILDRNGEKIQPAEGSTVEVKVELADAESESLSVVHFGEEETEVLDASQETAQEGCEVSFETGSFSVYAIVEAKEAFVPALRTVQTLEELKDNLDQGFLVSYNSSPRYMTAGLNKDSCFIENSNVASAAVWYFEAAEKENDYRIYTTANGQKQYVLNTSGNLVGLADATDRDGNELRNGTVFTLSEAAAGTFFVKHATDSKYLQHSNGGGGIRFYTDNNNKVNSSFTLTYTASVAMPDDYYELDGKSYGIAYHNDTAAAAALMAKTLDEKHLAAEDMLMRPDVLDNQGVLLVAGESSITSWTFHCVEQNRYTLTADTAEGTKYLTLQGQTLTLEESESENAVFTVTSGTGANFGKYQFTANGSRIELNLSGNNTGKGFWGTSSSGTSTWLNLVERSVLGDDDFNLYLARKVSVSDEVNIYNGQQVVLYTRIWNESEKKYEFYVVDHDGTLVRCYDIGDNVEWIGSQVNTALWSFTEYREADGTVNNYYELQNTQYGNYIAPQTAAETVMSDRPVGVNLNGRRFGENYTTIIAWDDANYAYVGLKHEDGSVTVSPLAEAEDFYFAVVNPVDLDDVLTTVNTVNNNDYGISMRMIDFNNPLKNDRDSVQHDFFGAHGNAHEMGLLTTNLGAGGYPMTTQRTGHEVPLSELFNDMTPVNHLFLQSILNESGYFEYDSTQNFAHLNEDGDFTVYDQLAAVGTSTGLTRTHGQFMPYNSILPGRYAYDGNGNLITNQTDVLAQELPDLNPRKGEKLYGIPDSEADYFFGMEMSASFTQTASGLDAWGHDIIFEFSGDDDFWLYVDGELVLDLGGVRSALTGSVNFRTGTVKNANTQTTLYEVFRKNYEARGLSKAQIEQNLGEIFEKNGDGQYVFKDYTNHSMRMFYMERGAGASNLRMRFNLAAVKPGRFTLSKTLSGADGANNDLIEFPYQVYYSTRIDGGESYHLLDNSYTAVYEGTSNAVKYAADFTPAGGTESYSNVFFLKPGQSAEFTMPNEVVDYYVVECGVNPDIYDAVRANDETLRGTATGNTVSGTARQDFKTRADSLENRSQVKFDNHVRDGAMRSLLITKKLYDVDGQKLLSYPENSTLYTMRLSLGDENASAGSLPLANLYAYYVKDPDGHYCRWDTGEQRFSPLPASSYDELQAYFAANNWSAADRESVIFRTSMNGSISKIPANYTVEIRDLIIGTQYMVEERAVEIPRGYTLREADGYTRVDGGRNDSNRNSDGVSQPYADTIRVNENPEIEVRNQKGWGLTVEKVWTDKDFMASHDDIYFAVYLRTGGGAGSDILYDRSVRRLPASGEIYYFFDDLRYGSGIYGFEDFIIREVTLTGEDLQVDETGAVTGYDSVTPIENGGKLTVGGTPAGGEHQDDYTYTVSYVTGESTGHNENVRIDTVTNSRPGIALYKTDWQWRNLGGAVFTLTDAEGKNVAAESYTSRSTDGQITIAYLKPGTYTLTETATPKGYVAMPEPVTITAEPDGTFRVSGREEYLRVTEAGESGMASVTVRNPSVELRVVTVDISTREPLENARYDLYRQVTDINRSVRRDYTPMAGYGSLLTNAEGLLETVTVANLSNTTYYLKETEAAEGYNPIRDDLIFTIGDDGTVSVSSEGHEKWITGALDMENGVLRYTITIPNGNQISVRFLKVDDASKEPLEGAVFHLEKAPDEAPAPETETGEDSAPATENPAEQNSAAVLQNTNYYNLTSGKDGLLTDEKGTTVFSLPTGTYQLTEIQAPEGYIPLAAAVTLTVEDGGVKWKLNNGSETETQAEKNATDVYTVTLGNTAGFEMPETGGAGTALFYLIGAMLTMTAGAVLTMKKKQAGTDKT